MTVMTGGADTGAEGSSASSSMGHPGGVCRAQKGLRSLAFPGGGSTSADRRDSSSAHVY